MTSKKYIYTFNFQYNMEDNCYIAQVTEFGPYISAFGDTYEETLHEIKSVFDLTSQTYKDDKLSPPKVKQINKMI